MESYVSAARGKKLLLGSINRYPTSVSAVAFYRQHSPDSRESLLHATHLSLVSTSRSASVPVSETTEQQPRVLCRSQQPSA